MPKDFTIDKYMSTRITIWELDIR